MQAHLKSSVENIPRSSNRNNTPKRILNRINGTRRFSTAMGRCGCLLMQIALFLFNGIKTTSSWGMMQRDGVNTKLEVKIAMGYFESVVRSGINSVN